MYKNKYCLITGGAGLLGPEHASSLAEIGYNIILIDIRQIIVAKIAITSSMIRSFLLPYLFDIFIRTIIAPIIPPIGDIDYNSLLKSLEIS